MLDAQELLGPLLAARSLLQIPAKVRQCDGFPTPYLAKPFFDRSQHLTIREDLGGLLQGLVLVHGDQDCRRTAPPGDDDMLSEIGNAVDDTRERTAQLTNGNGLGHGHKCTLTGTQPA